MNYLSSFVLLLLFLRCASTKKIESDPVIIHAAWNNWVGGIEGVGGVKYNLKILFPDTQALTLDSLIIDNESFKITHSKHSGDTLMITINENRSVSNTRIEGREKLERLELRKANPTNSYLVYSINNIPDRIPIINFIQTKSDYYQ